MDPVIKDLMEHVVADHGPVLGVQPATWKSTGTERDPRFTGTRVDGDRVVVDVRFARYENAGRYRGWLAISSAGARGAVNPQPKGWHSYTLMVGRLPDGNPWWSALWSMEVFKDNWETTVEPMSDGHWFRLNPGLLPVSSRPLVHDFIQPTPGLTEDVEWPSVDDNPFLIDYTPDSIPTDTPITWSQLDFPVLPNDPIVSANLFEVRIPRATREELEQVDRVLLRVRRSIRSERERRAEIAAV